MLPEFDALGVAVVGMSVDTVARLQKFRDKYGLLFPLASDYDRAIGAALKTLKGGPESTHERDTVVVAQDGTVVLAYKKVKASGHAAKVLADVKQARAEGRL